MSLSPQASALPGRVLILGLGWSGRVLAAQLQARGVQVAGTVRDPAASPDDGLRRYPLQAGTPPAPGLLEEIARAEAVLCSVPADAEGDPALRMLLPALHACPAFTDRVAMRCCSWRRGVHATWCALAWCSTACTCRIWPR